MGVKDQLCNDQVMVSLSWRLKVQRPLQLHIPQDTAISKTQATQSVNFIKTAWPEDGAKVEL